MEKFMESSQEIKLSDILIELSDITLNGATASQVKELATTGLKVADEILKDETLQPVEKLMATLSKSRLHLYAENYYLALDDAKAATAMAQPHAKQECRSLLKRIEAALALKTLGEICSL
jgi:hypothetical protein